MRSDRVSESTDAWDRLAGSNFTGIASDTVQWIHECHPDFIMDGECVVCGTATEYRHQCCGQQPIQIHDLTQQFRDSAWIGNRSCHCIICD